MLFPRYCALVWVWVVRTSSVGERVLLKGCLALAWLEYPWLSQSH